MRLRLTLVYALLACLAALPARAAAADDRAQDAALAHIEDLRAQGKVEEALAAYDAAIKDAERAQGAKSARVSKLTHDAAIFAMLLERYTDAESRARRALAIELELNGPQHGNVAAIRNTLSQILVDTGRYREAIDEAGKAVAITRAAFGEAHPNVGATLESLGKAQAAFGDEVKAEADFRQALAIEEKALGASHPAVAGTLISLAGLLQRKLRLVEAEEYLKRVVAIAQKNYGENHPNNATALSALAKNYLDQGRWADATTLLTRALDIREKVLGKTNSAVAVTLNDLAWADMGRGDPKAAEAKFRRALEVRAQAPHHQDFEAAAKGLANLARALREQKQFAEAQRQSQRALDLAQKAGLGQKPWMAPILTGAAAAALAQNQAKQAEDYARRALAVAAKTDFARVAALQVLADAELAQGKAAVALTDARAAATLLGDRKAEASLAAMRGDVRQAIADRDAFVLPVRATYAVTKLDPTKETALRTEAFETAQRKGEQTTARALWRMAARFAAHDDALAKLLREQQQLTLHLPEIETQYATLLSASDAPARARAEDRRKAADAVRARLTAIDVALRGGKGFQAYAELADPKPVSVVDLQALLKDNEAAVQFLVGEKASFVFAVSKQSVAWAKIDAETPALVNDVSALRRQIDPSLWEVMPPNIQAFDRARAHRLYQQLWSPIANVVDGKTNVIVVPDGPLTSLPLGILVTAPPAGGAAGDSNGQALRDTAWLIKKHALITLPSLSSLKALRRYAATTNTSEPFSGFGDPQLGTPDDVRSARRGAVARFFRGATVDQAQLAELGSLPQTAVELKTLAKAAGGNETADLWLQKRATETAIKATDLARKRVVAFSTHGLMAGEIGQGEPGLVFTLPKKATTRDDGFLAASEIADLKLGAEWVILSACNTAAGDKPGAEGLSGLSRAFFLAGAKSMLVSHWSVWDDASSAITTGTLARLKAKQAPNRAEALQQAMLAVMADKRAPRFAHPAAWAPFVLVGETIER